jgi:hypothetical protein
MMKQPTGIARFDERRGIQSSRVGFALEGGKLSAADPFAHADS